MALLHTKIQIPVRRGGTVKRSRLCVPLNAVFNCKLVSIIAPAGYGKTTLVSAWLLSKPNPFAWVSLDKSDNNPKTFLEYVIAALQRIDPHVGRQAAAMLAEDQSREIVLTELLNDFASLSDEWIIALDDYHVITNHAIHDSLAFILTNLPRNIHLLVTSRQQLPISLAGLRARGEVLELGPQDLKFTLDEVISFFKDVMGLDLQLEQVSILEKQTEGWIAGLQLAALSLRSRPDVNEFIEAFSSNDQFITEYLFEEVLRNIPDEMKDFLLKTSILTRLTAPLCDSVTQQTNAAQMLESLEASGMFTFSLDNNKQWFVYHHLFAHLLQKQLSRHALESIPALHQRAARWYAGEGLITEAVAHALDGRDYSFAIEQIEPAAMPMILSKDTVTLKQWLDALPEKMVIQNPRLYLATAWLDASLEGHLDQAFERALAIQENAEGELMAESMALLAFICKTRGEMDQALSYSYRALEQLQPSKHKKLYGFIIQNLGEAYRMTGDFDSWNAYLDSSFKLDLSDATMRCYLLFSSAVLLMARGKPDDSAKVCEEGIALSLQADNPNPISSALYMHLSQVECERNHLDKALILANSGLEIAEKWKYFYSLFWTNIRRCLILQGMGEHDQAIESVNRAMYYSLKEGSQWLYEEAIAFKAWMHILQGNVEEAVNWAQRRDLSVREVFHYSHTQKFIFLSYARVLIAQHFYEDAEIVLSHLNQLSRQYQRTNFLIEIMVLQALTFFGQGSFKRSMTIFSEAIQLGRPWGYFRIYINDGAPMVDLVRYALDHGCEPAFTQKLVEALRDEKISVSPLLTERELEIVGLLSRHLTSKEVADKLFISEHTVRSHIKNIYTKLDAHSRSEVIDKARDLRLI